MSKEKIDNTWPKSARLNNENRRKFVDTVLADVMPNDSRPEEEKFAEEWGQRVYDDIYGPLKEKMDALPQWMFHDSSRFQVDVFKHEACSSDWNNKDGYVNFRLKKPQRMINEENAYRWNRTGNEVMAQVDKQHDVIQAYKDHLNAADDWNSQWHELHNTLTEVADACNTSHQLFRAWPQALKYAEACFPYIEPKEVKRGGQTDVSAAELDLTAKIAQATAGTVLQN